MTTLEASMPRTAPLVDERQLYDALRAGDARAFEQLIDLYRASLLRLAKVYVRNQAVAEEVVQETWLGVLRGIDRFEQRSSLKTWIFRILTNTAKTRAEREGRTVPFSAMVETELAPGEVSVSPERFFAGADRWTGHWASSPVRWDDLPEERLLSEVTPMRERPPRLHRRGRPPSVAIQWPCSASRGESCGSCTRLPASSSGPRRPRRARRPGAEPTRWPSRPRSQRSTGRRREKTAIARLSNLPTRIESVLPGA